MSTADSAPTPVRRIVGPFNRVEGDLEVTLDIVAGRVAAAYVNSPLYRGFEQILQGKAPQDALTLVPRICGICSVAQSAAAARTLADAAGIRPPPNGVLAANIALAVENVADHLTHFYLYFMPDFARPDYAAAPWFGDTAARFRAVSGSAGAEFLAARAGFMDCMGLLAGKWPHTLALQPGGSTRPLQGSEIMRLQRLVRAFRRFLEQRCYGAALEDVVAIASREALTALCARAAGADFARFVALADALDLWRVGRGSDIFLCVGAYAGDDGALFPAGVWDGAPTAFDAAQVREDTSHGWYVATGSAEHPAHSATVPDADNPAGYSWCKAPRLGGHVVETGALARQVVAGQPLARALVADHGGSVAARVAARLIEAARVMLAVEGWLACLRPGEPYCIAAHLADETVGTGLVEAARGALGHWLSVRRGRIHNYQIIAPTTWNFSPRDVAGQPGALEQALAGLAVTDAGAIPAIVHHVVRSFDPCMVCTVH